MSSTELHGAVMNSVQPGARDQAKGENELKNDGRPTFSLTAVNINAQLGSMLGQFWNHLLGPGGCWLSKWGASLVYVCSVMRQTGVDLELLSYFIRNRPQLRHIGTKSKLGQEISLTSNFCWGTGWGRWVIK